MLSFADNVLYEALPYCLVGLGVVLTFRYLRMIDLTFAASFVAGPAIAATMLVNGAPFWLALSAAIALSALLAASTLALMRLVELDGLLAGLLSAFAGFAVTLLFTQGTLSLHDTATPFDALKQFDFDWVQGTLPLHPSQIALFLLVAASSKLLVDQVILRSEFGLAFRAMEDERSRATLLSSIGLTHWQMLSFGVIVGNVLCCTSGLLVMFKEGQVTATRGFDAVITVIAAYLLGNMLFEKRAKLSARSKGAANSGAKLTFALSPTSAAIAGVIFYFVLLAAVARIDVPASVPKLIMVALIVISFIGTQWQNIVARWELASRNHTTVVPPNEAFEAMNVIVEYPGFSQVTRVIDKANLRLQPSTATLLVGANGSGKSTFLRFLAGRLPGSGDVRVPTEGVIRRRRARRRHSIVGYVAQEAQLASAGTLSVLENLALFEVGTSATMTRHWQRPDASALPASVASLVKAAGDATANTLSAGQRQVLNIASLIVRKDAPRIVLLDEPLTHLDESNASMCVDLIERLLREEKTLLIVQHDIKPDVVSDASPSRTRLSALLSDVIYLDQIQQSNPP
ncbi:MAG: ATP-binding cassette domain-containing protein [Alphaproteobacteria bacterium]|nr:ATP-binding cassette domain-containing protein [Alphaproteobacteria bacterium]